MLYLRIRILTFVLVQNIHPLWKEQAGASGDGTGKESLENHGSWKIREVFAPLPKL